MLPAVPFLVPPRRYETRQCAEFVNNRTCLLIFDWPIEGMNETSSSKDLIEDTFFATTKPPEHFSEDICRIEAFITRHSGKKDVVLVTSGGTTVPLEKKMIRFLDNFSAGTRGAISAE